MNSSIDFTMNDILSEIQFEISAYIMAANCLCGLLFVISAVDVVCNSLLFLTTIRSKSLRSPCNILIGTCALFDVLHQSGNFLQSYGILRNATMNSWTCSVVMFVPEMSVSAGTFSVLSIGIDRFASIASPNRYRNMNTKKYLFVQYSAISTYCIYTAFLMVYYFREQELICGIATVFHDDAVAIWSNAGVAVNVTSLFFYVLTWRLIKSKSASLEIDQLRRIFRTIVLVTVLELGGFSICQTIVFALHWIELSAHKQHLMLMIAANFVTAGVATKFIVYYLTSTEYKKAFNNIINQEESSKVSHLTVKLSVKK